MKDTDEARKELVLRARQGDRGALTELMTWAVPIVTALVRGMLPQARNKEDLTQEALVRAMTHLKSLRDPGRFGAYLNEITRNLVFDVRRRRRPVGPFPEGSVSEAEGPADRLMKREEEDRVRRAILELGELDRQVVLLRHWSGASYEEIGSLLGLSVSAVQSRLFRARRELARLLGDRGAAGENGGL